MLRSSALQSSPPAVPVIELPDPADKGSSDESNETCYESGSDDESEEVPESANKIVPLDLPREIPPREWCRAEEADQEAAVGGEILDAGAAELIELGKDASSLAILSRSYGSGCRWLANMDPLASGGPARSMRVG